MKRSSLLVLSTALVVTGVLAQQVATPATPAASPAPVAVTTTDNTPAKPGDAKLGQTKAAACAACHSVDGNSADPINPKLAGQHEQFIARQLALFKSGERENAVMLGMATPLSAQDMRDIGAYFATQKVIAGLADESLIAEGPNAGKKFYQVGEKIYRSGKASAGVPACAACHGPAGAGMPGPTYPAIGGQHASYTAGKLTAFRDGMVWGKDKNANVIMSQAAKGLSDEDIQGLASYLQGLHTATKAAK
jgi:cytochrome c553